MIKEPPVGEGDRVERVAKSGSDWAALALACTATAAGALAQPQPVRKKPRRKIPAMNPKRRMTTTS